MPRRRRAARLFAASIIPDAAAGTLGHVRSARWAKGFDPDGLDRWQARRRLEPEILSLYGGVIAERRVGGRRHDWLGAESDLTAVGDLLGYCVGSLRQGDAYGRWLWVATEDLVDLWRPEIEAVAERLLEVETMRGDDVREIVRATVSAITASPRGLAITSSK